MTRVGMWGMAIAFAVAGCGSSKKEAKQAPEEEEEAPAAAHSAAVAPRPNPDTDPLWAWAPSASVGGFVAADGAFTQMLAAVKAGESLFREHEFGVEVADKALAGMRAEFPPWLAERPYEPETWAAIGVDVTKGAAVFFDGFDDAAVVVIVPVVDRERFRAATGLELKTLDGVEVDADDGSVCMPLGELYACSDKLQNLASMKADPANPMAKRVAALPGDLRGQLEFVVDAAVLGADPFGPPNFEKVGTAAITGQLTTGVLTVRGYLQATPTSPPIVAMTRVSNGLAAKVKARHPTGLYRMRLPVQLLADQAPPSVPVGSKQLATGPMLESLTGELLLYAPADNKPWMELDVGITNPAPLREATSALCELVGSSGLVVAQVEGGCAVTVPKQLLVAAQPAYANMPLDGIVGTLQVRDDRVAFSIDPMGEVESSPVQLADSPVSDELQSAPWTFSLWTSSAGGLGYLADLQSMGLPPEVTSDLELMRNVTFGLFLAAQLHEFGFAAAVGEHDIRGVMHFELFAADGPQVWQAYRTAVVQVLAGKQSWSEARAALVAAHPDTRVGRALSGGPSLGLMITVGGVGVMAAVAVPAFMKYIKKSKTTEARMFVKKLYDGAGSYRAEEGGFPKASTPLTPPNPTECCEKCPPDASLWSNDTWVSLAFSVDDPHYYSYQYVYDKKQDVFTVRAHGDLDCDGVWSTFEMYGSGKEPRGNTGGLFRERELE